MKELGTHPNVLESNPLSVLCDRGREVKPSALFNELLLEDPLSSPLICFCLAGSNEFNKASA